MTDGTTRSDALELAAMIDRKEISALEAVDAAIARAEAVQPELNFLVSDNFTRARERAAAGGLTGPLAGVPYLVKNMTDVEGTVTRWGARFTEMLPPAAANSPQVAAMEAAGLIVIGTSAMGEMGFLPTTEPVAFGPTRNPWDLDRTPGGSSGGATAAVAAGVVPMADAFDGGGSIRIPASCSGVFGLKPTRGRLVGHHEPAAGFHLTAEHCVSRTVRDSAALFTAMEDAASGLPGAGAVTGPSDRRLRVGYLRESLSGHQPDPDVRAATDAAATLLDSLGHGVEDTSFPFHGPSFFEAFMLIYMAAAAEVVGLVQMTLGAEPDDSIVEPLTLAMAQRATERGPEEIDAAKTALTGFAADYHTWFERFDVIVSPVLLQAPIPIGHITGDVPTDVALDRIERFVADTPLENAAGAPAMSVPLHWTADALPVGLHVAADVGDDRTLFELAYELEAASPWAHRRPPVFAD